MMRAPAPPKCRWFFEPTKLSSLAGLWNLASRVVSRTAILPPCPPKPWRRWIPEGVALILRSPPCMQCPCPCRPGALTRRCERPGASTISSLQGIFTVAGRGEREAPKRSVCANKTLCFLRNRSRFVGSTVKTPANVRLYPSQNDCFCGFWLGARLPQDAPNRDGHTFPKAALRRTPWSAATLPKAQCINRVVMA